VAATDNPAIVAPVNQTGNIVFLPFDDAEAVARFFEERGNDIAAVIVEPIQGVGGIRVAGTTFLQQVRSSCTQYGALMIADEVQCGCGRSGSYFMLDHSGINADVYTMAKGIGNGFPVGGLLIAPHIKPWHGMLGTTFGGNHLACAAALAVLEVMETEGLLTKAAENGRYLKEQLQMIPGLQNVRGEGLMIGFDVPDAFKDLRKNLLTKHFIFTGEAKPSAVRLLPALSVTRDELDEFLAAVRCEMHGAGEAVTTPLVENAVSH
jgi:acetylornithine aminotransferase